MSYDLREWYAMTASSRAPGFMPPSLSCRNSFGECVMSSIDDACDHDVFIWKWIRSSRRWRCEMFLTRKVARFLTD